MQALCPYAGIAGRVLIAVLFVVSGLSKISHYEATENVMDAAGVPGILLPLVILLEAGGGLAVIVGWQTRIIAFLLAGFCLLTAILFHADWSEHIQFVQFMKDVSIAGGFLFLVANGPGLFALDNRKAKS